jgi:hypothetical protein
LSNVYKELRLIASNDATFLSRVNMVMRAGFTVMTPTQSNNPPNGKVKSKVKSMFIIFFDIKRIIHEEFVLADQTVNSAYYCDVLRRLYETVRRLRPELWHQRTGTVSNFLFSPQNFLPKNNMTVVPNPSYSPDLGP